MSAQNKNTDAMCMRNHLICSLDSFGINNTGKILKEIAAIGFKAIEISCSQSRPSDIVPECLFGFRHDPGHSGNRKFSLPDLAEWIHSFGLKAEVMNASCELCHPRSVEWLRRRIDAAKQLGIDILSTGIGRGWEKPEARDIVRDNLQMAGRYAGECGKIICVKTEAWLAEGADEMLRFMDGVNSKHLKIDFDPSLILYHRSDTDLTDYLKKIMRFIGCVHLRGIMKRDGRSGLPQDGSCPVNYQRIFSLLNENGFYGPFCVELDYAYFWESNSAQIPMTHASWQAKWAFDSKGLQERSKEIRGFLTVYNLQPD